MDKLLSRLRQELPEGLRILEQMVNMDSPSTEKTLVDPLVRWIGSQFESVGGSVDYIPDRQFGEHLRVNFTGKKPERILLLGHTDTVFSAGEAIRRPFRIEDGRATGPGVFDMKSGILLMWLALRVLECKQVRPENSVTVLLTSCEEVGSVTSRGLLEDEAKLAKAVLVLEPSLPGGVLKTARKGVGRFSIKCIGRAAHAGVDPEKGINAIEEISRQILAMHSLNDLGKGTTVTVGTIQGGTRSNVVPAEAMAEVDVRVSAIDEADRITKAMHALQAHIAGAKLEVSGGINRPPMERTEHTARLFGIAQTVGREIGLELKEGSTGGASDGNFTAALGIPTLDGLGPVGGGAHALDEFVEVESIPQRAALIAGLIQRL
jgi:glutamate carboxypeptidase